MQQVFITFAVVNEETMIQLQKDTWLIDTIRRAGKISLEEISDRWERNKELSDYKPLSRATFNRWKDTIFSQFGIIISCQRSGGYLYYIENLVSQIPSVHRHFELFLAPTYDFVMRLLHVGAMIEVISPVSLRKTMIGWISDMYNLYKNDK